MFRQIVLNENGRSGANWNAGATINALYRINVEHFCGINARFIFPWMNAVNRTSIDTSGISHPNTCFSDVCHKAIFRSYYDYSYECCSMLHLESTMLWPDGANGSAIFCRNHPRFPLVIGADERT